jgi:hypothetical protein
MDWTTTGAPPPTITPPTLTPVDFLRTGPDVPSSLIVILEFNNVAQPNASHKSFGFAGSLWLLLPDKSATKTPGMTRAPPVLAHNFIYGKE